MKYLSILLLLVIIAVSCKTVKNSNKQLFVTTYQWEKLGYDDIGIIPESEIEFVGSGLFKQKDSFVYVLALDTTTIILKVNDGHKTKQYTIIPTPNSNFNESWKDLPLGEKPTPMTQEQTSVFRLFSKYKLLNEKAPDFEVNTIQGEVLNEKMLHGKITLLNFWYCGCLPCMAELPALNTLQKKYANDTTVQIFSVFNDSIMLDKTGQQRFQSTAYSSETSKFRLVNTLLTQIPNGKELNSSFNVIGFPTNLIIDNNGVIRKIEVGANPEGDNSYLVESFTNQIEALRAQMINQR
jgi:thiol-disulfide isomerase/thioredoxin